MRQPPVHIRHDSVPFAGLDPGLDGLRIAHVSDLHLRRWDHVLECLAEWLVRLDYDILAVTGDFCEEPEHWRRVERLANRLFEPLDPPLDKFAVLGNHDAPDLGRSEGIPLRFLNDEYLDLDAHGHRLPLIGVDQSMIDDSGLRKALKEVPAGYGAVLLAHYPSTVYRLWNEPVGLVLSGHTHGGQIRLPGIGCVWPNDAICRHKSRGLHVINGTALHVSAGVGVSGPIRRRLFCPPEISILTLYACPGVVAGAAEGEERLESGMELVEAGLSV